MKKTEAKELTIKYIDSFFNEFGFKLSKTTHSEVRYRRINPNGFDGFASGTLDYNPVQIIVYSVYKRINQVEDIIKELSKKINISSINEDDKTIAFGYETLNGINKQTTLPDMKTEEDLISCVETIKTFMRETAIPLLDRFNDLREIDKEINGDKPWETDWKQKFNLGGNFHEKRLIIAKLANNPNYDDLVKFEYNWHIEGLKGKYKEDFEEGIRIHECLIEILKDVSPLYDSYID